MSTQRNTSTTSRGRPTSTRQTMPADESKRRALEAESRVLGAFPWARWLTPPDRMRFADELANHPTDMSNAELETFLVSWRATADTARRRHEAGHPGGANPGRH